MAAKTKSLAKSTNKESQFIIPIEKKKKIFGIFISVIALLVLLSILSYSRADEANLTSFFDIFKVFSDDPSVIKKLESVQNWLGIFGAYTSYFFIHSTLGFFSIIFPVILFIWGYTVVKQENYKMAVYVSNFLLIIAVILATFFGMLRFELGIFVDINELSGNVGGFFGKAVGRLLGGLGSVIFLVFLLFVSVFVVFDIKLGRLVEFVKNLINDGEEKTAKLIKTKEKKSEDNLQKIKTLRKIKKEKPVVNSDDEDDVNDVEPEYEPEIISEAKEKETRIRIVNNENQSDFINSLIEPDEDEPKFLLMVKN